MERGNFAGKMLHRYEQGVHRAEAGKPIVVDAVRGITSPEIATAYIMGYMNSVVKRLAEIGITQPDQIGIHESFMHIVVQDPKVEGTSGIEGLSDGMRLNVPKSDEYKHLGKSPLNHYQDGYKIGFAFALAKTRRGDFELLPAEPEISPTQKTALNTEIKEWLEGKGVTWTDAGIVLHFHPLARLSFAYYLNNGEDGFEEYSQGLSERVNKNTDYSTEQKQAILEGIERSFKFAKKVKFTGKAI